MTLHSTMKSTALLGKKRILHKEERRGKVCNITSLNASWSLFKYNLDELFLKTVLIEVINLGAFVKKDFFHQNYNIDYLHQSRVLKRRNAFKSKLLLMPLKIPALHIDPIKKKIWFQTQSLVGLCFIPYLSSDSYCYSCCLMLPTPSFKGLQSQRQKQKITKVCNG